MAYSGAIDAWATPKGDRLKRELIIALVLLIVGLLVLPVPVYWVGERVFGPYTSEEGLWGLATHIWGDLGRGSPLAWTLVLSPYLIVQLLRFGRTAWRLGKHREPSHSSQ